MPTNRIYLRSRMFLSSPPRLRCATPLRWRAWLAAVFLLYVIVGTSGLAQNSPAALANEPNSHPSALHNSTNTIAQRIYFVTGGAFSIAVIDTDGSNLRTIISGAISYRALAVDDQEFKLYYTEKVNEIGYIYRIVRANLNGSGADLLLETESTPGALALDISAGKMYWTEEGTQKVRRANLDGSNVETIVTSLQRPWALTLDLGRGRMYWSESVLFSARIRRANLDGTDQITIVDGLVSDIDGIDSMDFDPINDLLHWTNAGLYRCDPDGNQVFHVTAGTGQIEVDSADLMIYKADFSGGIVRFKMNLTFFEQVTTTSAYFLALDYSAGDCNGNGVGDDDDIAMGTSTDCDGNSLPDECDPPQSDCNNNGVGDICDIVEGTSADVDGDGRPDECCLATTPEQDCNGNGFVDTCDLDDESSKDCNENAVPDECDIAQGQSVDANGDGFPDECGRVYWSSVEDPELPGSIDQLRSANSDGSNNIQFITQRIYEVAINLAVNKLYWITSSALWEANLDGSEATNVGSMGKGASFAVDPVQSKIYSIDDGVMQRADLDGGNIETVLITSTFASNMAVDPFAQKVYWTDSSAGSIYRVNTDGTTMETVVGPGESLFALDIDLCAGKLYWSDYSSETIRRADLNGANVEDVPIDTGSGGVTSLKLDLAHGKIYWITYWTAVVRRCNLDGSDIEFVVGTNGIGTGLAIDPGAEDCNGNGVLDRCDAMGGFSEDLNANQVPDECESDVCVPGVDCNSNGVLDICDITAGTSEDCNNNDVPDECDPLQPDCNNNGVLDICDITAGTSEDCNNNEIPDECDITAGTSFDCDGNGVPDACQPYEDCDGNGVRDICEIAAGTSEDCNENIVPDACDITGGTSGDCQPNGIPDECEIAAGSSADCTLNGIPDECEPDCNGNIVADSCDLSSGTSLDCNLNDVPDECESDCNLSGFPDDCDLAEGTSLDCNTNLIPDECDIASGTASDCNANDVPDVCDIAIGPSLDCDANAIPDECEPPQPDCNNNGVGDGCDIAEGTSDDCNLDRVPDDCQPDEDCNNNGTRDICDIGAATSLDCNLNLVPDSCDIAQGTSQDDNGDGRPDECCLFVTQPALQRQFDENGDSTGPPEPKNRVLAVTAGDAGQQQAVRVTWDAQPNWAGGHAALVGQQKWMTAPFKVCENSGQGLETGPPNCSISPGQPQRWFWAANLTCDSAAAHFADLTMLMDFCTASGEACTSDVDCAQGTCGVDGVIHIFDQGIAPSKNDNQQAIYSVQVIVVGCALTVEDNFSNALVLTQPVWGDIGNVTGCPMAPPNGVASLIPDVTNALAKFSNAFCAPKKTRVDVNGESLNFKVDIVDVLALLNAFSSGSASYSFSAGPACSVGG